MVKRNRLLEAKKRNESITSRGIRVRTSKQLTHKEQRLNFFLISLNFKKFEVLWTFQQVAYCVENVKNLADEVKLQYHTINKKLYVGIVETPRINSELSKLKD